MALSDALASVRHRHGVSRERHHLCAICDMEVKEGRLAESRQFCLYGAAVEPFKRPGRESESPWKKHWGIEHGIGTRSSDTGGCAKGYRHMLRLNIDKRT